MNAFAIDEKTPRDRNVLLRFEGLPDGFTHKDPFWIEGWWFSSSKEIDDGWETPLGSIGEPTHWAELPVTFGRR